MSTITREQRGGTWFEQSICDRCGERIKRLVASPPHDWATEVGSLVCRGVAEGHTTFDAVLDLFRYRTAICDVIESADENGTGYVVPMFPIQKEGVLIEIVKWDDRLGEWKIIEPDPRPITHVFRIPGSTMWEHRQPGEWIGDVIGYADLPCNEVGESTELPGGWTVEVTAPERTLRFVCALLNQHAEQHPQDTTPVDEAARLEQVIAEYEFPDCPNCEQHSWHVDLTAGNVRMYVSIGWNQTDFVHMRPDIRVDRVNPAENLDVHQVGSIDCRNCGLVVLEAGTDGETVEGYQYGPELHAAIVRTATAALTRQDNGWKILNDYTEL